MITIYETLHGAFTGRTTEIEDDEPRPVGWVTVAPPELEEGQYAIWLPTNVWMITTEAPVVPEQPVSIVRIPRPDFMRLFTIGQRLSANILRSRITSLTLAERMSGVDPVEPNLEVQGMMAAEIVFQNFDLPAEFIELTHPDTLTGLNVLALCGVFQPDDANEEIARVLSNTLPSV